MTQVSVEIVGTKELAERYRGASTVINRELTRSMTRVVTQGQALSQSLAPKWRHQLERSITSRVWPMSGGVRGQWGTVLYYAGYVEKGTRRHYVPAQYIGAWAKAHGFGFTGIVVSGRAQPFIQPAFDQIRGGIQSEFAAAVDRIIAQMKG